MKFTTAQRVAKLRYAIALLKDVDVLVQQALGDCDVCEETHKLIEDIVEDLRCDVLELEQAE